MYMGFFSFQILRDRFDTAQGHRRLQAEGGHGWSGQQDQPIQEGMPQHLRMGDQGSSAAGGRLHQRQHTERECFWTDFPCSFSAFRFCYGRRRCFLRMSYVFPFCVYVFGCVCVCVWVNISVYLRVKLREGAHRNAEGGFLVVPPKIGNLFSSCLF